MPRVRRNGSSAHGPLCGQRNELLPSMSNRRPDSGRSRSFQAIEIDGPRTFEELEESAEAALARNRTLLPRFLRLPVARPARKRRCPTCRAMPPCVPSMPPGRVTTHVIYIVQENRSFDNLFRRVSQVDTVLQGMNSSGQTITLQPSSLKNVRQ